MKHFEMYGGAVFVSPSDVECTAPWIRGTFQASMGKDYEITICGLGVFELYINGKKVSDDLLVPACSLYEHRENKKSCVLDDERFTYRVYSMRYNVSEYVKDGKNTLCVLLGRGWYSIPGNYDERCDIFGNVKLCFTLKQGENVVMKSDETLKWTPSHITYNCLFNGERHDYSLYRTDIFEDSFDDGAFANVVKADTPEADFNIQECPTDKVIRTIKPVLIKDFGDKKIYDNGENITGYVRMAPAKAGETVTLEHTEDIDENGMLDGTSFNSFRRAQIDSYICDGKTEMCPRFTFHGFRYFSVEGASFPIETLVVHSDVDVTSSFKSDNETLNWLYSTFVRTQLDNMHMGVPSDCPTREKLGYTGDGQLLADAVMTMFDAKSFYKKWIRDIADSQDIATGHVLHTAPVQGGGGGIGGWGSAIIEVPYMYWKHYDDISIIQEYLPNMIRFMDYMYSRYSFGFITGENKGQWCLGDWGFPDEESKELLPQNYVNTYFYVKDLNRMAEMCNALGKKVLAESYAQRASYSTNAIRAAYMSPMSDNFCADVAGANSFAMDIGLGTYMTLDNTVKKYSETRKLDTGIFATDILIRLLFEKGKGQTAFDLLTSHVEKYSFGYMMDMGATTLWEYTTGFASHNHPMFGACVKHLFTYLLGIKATSNAYKTVTISPVKVEGLNKCEGHITTPQGVISVNIDRTGEKTVYKIVIPENTEATFMSENYMQKLSCGENTVIE